MKALLNFIYGLLFVLLIVGTVAALYFYANPVFWFYIANLFLTFCYFKVSRNPITRWGLVNLVSIDQTWQVLFSPLLNIGVRTKHKFGDPDETASSVVGKNLIETNERRWIIIEWFLSVLLEGGKPHAKRQIETDEGYHG